MPLSARQLRVLVAAVARELAWSLPAVSKETRAWRLRARAITDAATRTDALSSLASKRGHTDGAALFTILPRARSMSLLRLLVAYEITWDFLDSANERAAAAGQPNGLQLHRALIDALDPGAAISDHYRHHPWRRDGGYLRALVEACRRCCEQLPGYASVRDLALVEARRAQVLAINHELDPIRRDADLQAWATRMFPADRELAGEEVEWFELTGAASASLTVHALLALAAEHPHAATDPERTRNAYFPWVSAATTMLDSFVDQPQDLASGDHSYVAHYQSYDRRVARIGALIERSLDAAHKLPNGERHGLIVACMAAMYLAKDSARGTGLCVDSKRLAQAGGALTRLLLPVLRLWRVAYSQQST